MHTFSGVASTGIYCRPGCGGRPAAANLRPFPLAAAAEAAGYRACFQCRPYRWPECITWNGPELVCRAVRLILDGALDNSTEVQLGDRLGVSARHLRRLCTAHLGVTPDALARSARAHFARRLLDDTDLAMVDIAVATGFGSVRQFNRELQSIFRAPPRTLREKRRKADRLIADGGLPLRLMFRGPLDWDVLVSYLKARAIPGVESVSGHTYRRTIVVAGDPGVIELSRGGEDHLLVVAHLPHWEGLVHLVARARRIANLDFELEEPAAQLSRDSTIGPLLSARPGVRTPGAWDPFEAGVRAIVGQQVTLAAANTITGRIVERFGDPVPGLGGIGLTHTFPAPATLAVADLTEVGLPRARQETIRSFARAVAADALRLDGSVRLDELVASLTEIDGVGPWTANYVALRLGEPDAFPATDLGLRRAFEGRSSGAAAALGRRANGWRPWRALAATHLWVADSAGWISGDDP